MRIYAPDYYREFVCIGGKCRHSCCIGWEIDVDAAAYEKYKKAEGAFGKRLREGIAEGEDGAHFCLNADERCPFLNADNLCDIILTMGEDALCQICADHPRYRNFLESRTEIGVGLSCEAAAALILGRTEKPEMIWLEGDGEAVPTEEEALFLQLRDEILDMVFADKTAEDCMVEIAARFAIVLPSVDWTAFYTGLEVLHEDWRTILQRLSKPKTKAVLPDAPIKQLLGYFLYRHLADGLSDGRYKARIAFALHATQVIWHLAGSKDTLCDAARRYSEEIEYSAENTEALLAILEE